MKARERETINISSWYISCRWSEWFQIAECIDEKGLWEERIKKEKKMGQVQYFINNS